MQQVVSVDNMRKSDALTIERLVPSRELMRRAAQGIFDSRSWDGHTAVICGSGNNGGDGYALTEILADAGCEASIHMVSEKTSEDGAFYLERARAKGVPVSAFDATDPVLAGASTIVDCMLGTGFSGEPRANVAAAIDFVNASGAFVVSCDINSGLDGETGKAVKAVHSDLTVSIGYFKNGMFLNDAGNYIGRLVNAPIGIELEYEENSVVDQEEFEALLERYSGYIMPFPEDDVATEDFGMIDDLELLTPVEAAGKLASTLHVNVHVKGHTTDYLANGGNVTFLSPTWCEL